MKLLSKHESDDLNYIINVENIIQDRINLWKPDEIYITRIDNWFDEKWLDFSGVLLGALGIWKGKTTIPPFHPNRVKFTKLFVKIKDNYSQQKLVRPLHILQESNQNLQRYIENFSKNGLFIWYSGNSKKNYIGSLMCYYVIDNECFSFYVSLNGKNKWNIDRANGISKKEMQRVINKTNKENFFQSKN